MIIVTKMAELVKRFCGKCHFVKNKGSPSPTPPPRECAGEGKKCCPARFSSYCHFEWSVAKSRNLNIIKNKVEIPTSSLTLLVPRLENQNSARGDCARDDNLEKVEISTSPCGLVPRLEK